MKLSFPLLYYPLKKHFPIQRISCNPSKIYVDRPVCFVPGSTFSGRAVLLDAEDLPLVLSQRDSRRSCIFLCFGDISPTHCRVDAEVLVLNSCVKKETVLNTLQEIFDLFDRLESSLQEAYWENQSFRAMLTGCEEVFDQPFSLTDANFSYVFYSRRSDDAGLTSRFVNDRQSLPISLASVVMSDPVHKKTSMLREIYSYTLEQTTTLCKNIFYGEEAVGKLFVLQSQDPTTNEYHRELLSLTAYHIEKLYARYGSFHPARAAFGTLHTLLEQAFLGKPYHKDSWESALEAVRWEKAHTYLLLQLRPNYRYDKNLYSNYLCPEIEKLWKGSCCVEYGSSLFVLLNQTVYDRSSSREFRQELAYFLRENLLAAGLSRPFGDLEHLLDYRRQTDLAFTLGIRKDPYFWYFKFDDYALDFFLQQGMGGFTPDQVCHPGLTALLEHDKRIHTDYFKTLKTYVQCRYNAALTAQTLYIHRSTFLNRLERIRQVGRMDLEDPDCRLYLEISLKLLSSSHSPVPEDEKKDSSTEAPPCPPDPTPKLP